MQKRRLGRTSLEITPIVFGGNVLGWTVDEKHAFDLLDRFVAAGFNTIDTADSYSRWVPGNKGGESETIIGNWLAARRNRSEVIIATKVASEMGEGKAGLAPAYIEAAVEDSLRRLRTDVIDLYQSHWHDPLVPYADTLGAYQRLIEKGKVRFIGASNHTADQLRDALDTAAAQGLPRYESIQPSYNLYDRSTFEGPLRDLCIEREVGAITYYGLAKGFLSGKYRSADDLGKGPRSSGVADYLNERGYRILAALDAVALDLGARPAEVALAWLIAQPGVVAPIASATNAEQLLAFSRAAELSLSPDHLRQLDEASA
ncbi:MAG: aldo/keto reductase [Rhizobiaceae bacterium]|nr:aldo/keto reductase [Rhizobiaceae bacterium]